MSIKTFFQGFNTADGSELWVTDGTAAGTMLVDDIRPGTSSSNPSMLAALGSDVVFAANDGTHGSELWISDGTTAGTKLLDDINAGSGSSNPFGLTAIGSKVVFRATDGATHGSEIWATDGTTAGTVLLKDIATGVAGSYPSNFTPFGSELLFGAKGNDGFGLWETDGTAAGTKEIKTIYPNASISGSSPFAIAGSKAFFAASNGVNGNELWVTDGTAAGTAMVKDIDPGSASSNPAHLTAIGNKVVFVANDGTHGSELWVSDGTGAGTYMLKDIVPGSNGSSIYYVAAMGTHALFFANDGSSPNNQLWSTDGTSAGTVELASIRDTGTLAVIGNEAVFKGNDGVHGDELWVSDGTAAGTGELKDLFPGPSGSYPYGFTNTGGQVFLTADDSSLNFGLWQTDGTAAGTFEISSAVSEPKNFVAVTVPACFAAGSRILTVSGDVAVERLVAGDRVETVSGPARIGWVGHSRVDAARHPRPWDVYPVRIRAGAFGAGLPRRDLLLSPEHAVYAEGVLIPVRHLVNDATIVQEVVEAITYYHIELDAHGAVFAEGLTAESYRDTGNRSSFDGAPVRALHAGFSGSGEAVAFAPIVEAGPALDRVVARLASLARGVAKAAPALRVDMPRPGRMEVMLPAGVGRVQLVSPWCMLSGERRRLGAAVSGVTLAGMALEPACFGAGFHALETDGGSWRWTNGRGVLLVDVSDHPRSLVIDVVSLAVPAAIAA